MPFNTAFYTWTDTNKNANQDAFQIVWKSDDGRFSDFETWNVTLASPYKTPRDCDPCKKGCPCAGNPFIISTGSKTEQVTDYETAGPNTLGFRRYYNNYPDAGPPPTAAATLGRNWRSDFDRYLHLVSSNSQVVAVLVERDNQQLLTFLWNGSRWTSDSDVDLQLTQAGSTWTLLNTDDTVETYTDDGSGRGLLTSIRAQNGYTQTLQYDSNGLLLSVTDAYGRALSFTYQNGLLQTVTPPDSLVLSYSYTASGLSGSALGRLAAVTYSTNPATSQAYLYENASLPLALTGIVDENGNHFATWAYDSLGRIISSQHAGGADLTTVAYNNDGSRTITNALGQVTQITPSTCRGACRKPCSTREASPESPTVQYHFLAVSVDADPTHGFFVYPFNARDWVGSGVFWDYPQIGYDENAIILTGNKFNPGYGGSTLVFLPKHRLYAGLAFSYCTFNGGPLDVGTIAPPLVLDQGPYTALAAASPGANLVRVTKWMNTSHVCPTLLASNDIGTSTTVPPLAQQPGFTDCSTGPGNTRANCLDTLDGRFQSQGTQVGTPTFGQPVRFWQVRTTGGGGFPEPLTYRVNADALAIEESCSLSASGTSFDFNPAIVANEVGTLFVTWSSTDPTNTLNAQVHMGGKLFGDAGANPTTWKTFFFNMYNP